MQVIMVQNTYIINIKPSQGNKEWQYFANKLQRSNSADTKKPNRNLRSLRAVDSRQKGDQIRMVLNLFHHVINKCRLVS